MKLWTITEVSSQIGIPVHTLYYAKVTKRIPPPKWIEGRLYYDSIGLEEIRRFFDAKGGRYKRANVNKN